MLEGHQYERVHFNMQELLTIKRPVNITTLHSRCNKYYSCLCKWHGVSHMVIATTLLPMVIKYVTLVYGDLSSTQVRNITQTYSYATIAKEPTDRTTHSPMRNTTYFATS
jgi:hypothetical protein